MMDTLVKETLTTEQVKELVKNDSLTIFKGRFETWDGESHEGYIVSHSSGEKFFMETTLKEVENPFKTYHLYKQMFYKLMPISSKPGKKPLPKEGTMVGLCKYIIDTEDTWYYASERKLIPLTLNDIECYIEKPLTKEEKEKKDAEDQAYEDTLIALFSNGELPPPEDDAWYSILSEGYGSKEYDFETKILKILRSRGINAYIDGEKDSFGWVTRGIFVDDQCMAIY